MVTRFILGPPASDWDLACFDAAAQEAGGWTKVARFLGSRSFVLADSLALARNDKEKGARDAGLKARSSTGGLAPSLG
ncbi:MAG TPA: hypothetical protein VLA96_12795, partial [Terriglobales bacterium]|nr:hypothetical protein [Terriglobales bacterium]